MVSWMALTHTQAHLERLLLMRNGQVLSFATPHIKTPSHCCSAARFMSSQFWPWPLLSHPIRAGGAGFGAMQRRLFFLRLARHLIAMPALSPTLV